MRKHLTPGGSLYCAGSGEPPRAIHVALAEFIEAERGLT